MNELPKWHSFLVCVCKTGHPNLQSTKSLKKLDTNFQLAFYLQKRNKTLFGFIILAIFQTNRNKNMERVLFTILLSWDSMIGTTLLDLYLTLSSKLGSLQSRLLSELS